MLRVKRGFVLRMKYSLKYRLTSKDPAGAITGQRAAGNGQKVCAMVRTAVRNTQQELLRGECFQQGLLAWDQSEAPALMDSP